MSLISTWKPSATWHLFWINILHTGRSCRCGQTVVTVHPASQWVWMQSSGEQEEEWMLSPFFSVASPASSFCGTLLDAPNYKLVEIPCFWFPPATQGWQMTDSSNCGWCCTRRRACHVCAVTRVRGRQTKGNLTLDREIRKFTSIIQSTRL